MKRLIPLVVGLLTATLAFVHATPPQYGLQGTVTLAPSNPVFTAVDPFMNPPVNNVLKPARPFWYAVDENGLKIMRITDNMVLSTVPWPTSIDVVQPDGSYTNVPAPPGGWEPVGMVVSYPTEEQLASNSETPVTNVYVVMAHSGYEWRSNPAPPDLRNPNLRDELVPSTNPDTESSMLVAVDVTDPIFASAPPAIAGAILGHGAGQPAFDPSVEGTVYVGNMPSMSLPTTPTVPNDLTSFVSIISGLASPAAEAGEVGAAPTILILCGPEHPEEGLLKGVPEAWACIAEGGEGPLVWEFSGLPPWLLAHADKLSGQLDGILYGTPLEDGSYTFQVRVTDYGPEPAFTSDWATITLNVTPTGVVGESEAGWEVGVPNGVAIEGTGSCDFAPTASPGSLVPEWIDVAEIPGREIPNPTLPEGHEHTKGCVVMATAPISGEYFEFAMPNFKFAYPFDREPVIISGNVGGPYVFDPLPFGVTISGLAWHQIDKIHDASTEADILNAELFGVEPFTGQLYQIVLPQGELEVGDVAAAPATQGEMDEVRPYGTAVEIVTALTTSRPEIGAALVANPELRVRFGNLAVEANRDPNVYVTAVDISDPTGVNPAVVPIGGPPGSTIPDGAVLKVTGTRDTEHPEDITLSTIGTISIPEVQAYSLGLESDLRPAVRGTEPGQVDNGVLWVTGHTTGNVAVVDTVLGSHAQMLAVPSAISLGGVSSDFVSRAAYVAGRSLQNVTIFGIGTPPAPAAPVIWGGTAEHGIEATLILGSAGSITIMATGWPTPTLSLTGTLPEGVTFADNGNGFATLSGTPAVGTEGEYTGTIRATNGVPPDDSEAFLLTVSIPPVITSANTTTFTVGTSGSFTVTATGYPTPTLTRTGTLPDGVTFVDNGDGTATLGGTPAVGTEGSYALVITAMAGEGAPPATQDFMLIVNPAAPGAPVVTAQPSNQTVVEGQTATFTAAAIGNPEPTVQWQLSTDSGATWADVAGATSISYTTPATTTAMSGYQFRAVFTNIHGTATSNAAILTVTEAGTPPTITSANTTTFTVGSPGSFEVRATGSPIPSLSATGPLPSGVVFVDNHNGTAALAGTPAGGTQGTYHLTIRATNGWPPDAVQNFTLIVNAVGTAPAITSANATTFTVGFSGSFTVTTIGSPTPSVNYAGSLPAGVTFVPNANGTATLSGTPAAGTQGNYPLTITATNGVPPDAVQNFSLTVIGGPPVATLSPTSLGFARQVIETTSAAKTVTLTNSGPGPLIIDSIATSGSFVIEAKTCGATLAAGAKCIVRVSFSPTVVGAQSGVLTFTDNAADSPQLVALTGTAVLPATLTPVMATYAAQAVGTTSAPKLFTLTNNQNVNLTGITPSTTGDFAISATTCAASLAPRGKCTISVTFTPTAAGVTTGTLTVSHSATNSPQTSSLTGTGSLPATLTPTTATYASRFLGTTSAPKTFTLINRQRVSLDDIAIVTTGDFAVSATTCGTSLAAGARCTISVTFTPTVTGPRTGSLIVNDSASNSPQTSSLTGTGR